jgi:SWI/SNF related-matrix-associated actin-dependent regulator of chromatin subfamily C
LYGQLGVTDPDAALVGDAVHTPFIGGANPVMANVAFLATCVGPRVAAAAARAALQALADEVTEEEEKGGGSCGAKAKAKEELIAATAELDAAAAAAAGAGAMDVDGSGGARAGGGAAAAAAADDEEGDLGPAPELTVAQVRSAAATGLAAAAVRAKLLADQEEQEIQKLVVGLVQVYSSSSIARAPGSNPCAWFQPLK